VTWTRHGEPLQFYGSGGGTHSIHNNLLVRQDMTAQALSGHPRITLFPLIQGEQQIRDGWECLRHFLQRNTLHGGNTSFRINGFFDDNPHLQVINATIFIEVIYGYLYTENGGGYTQGTGGLSNPKYATIALSGVDRSNHYLPPSDPQGYRYVPGGGGGGTPYTPTIKNFFIRHTAIK
jgi:hypothetical protein